MKCGADKNTTCMARQGDMCMEHLMTDTPTCSSRVPFTNADRMIASIQDTDNLTELLWCDGWAEAFGIPDFSTKQELSDWLQQPAMEDT